MRQQEREGVSGSGPGVITPDGCAVELYARLPAMGEPEIVHAAVPAGASIIEFGCGTGRIGTPLARLGHRVVGVDESPEMLALCREFETVCCSIEEPRVTVIAARSADKPAALIRYSRVSG